MTESERRLIEVLFVGRLTVLLVGRRRSVAPGRHPSRNGATDESSSRNTTVVDAGGTVSASMRVSSEFGTVSEESRAIPIETAVRETGASQLLCGPESEAGQRSHRGHWNSITGPYGCRGTDDRWGVAPRAGVVVTDQQQRPHHSMRKDRLLPTAGRNPASGASAVGDDPNVLVVGIDHVDSLVERPDGTDEWGRSTAAAMSGTVEMAQGRE